MKYKKFLRDDINIKILSNFELSFADIEKDFEKFKKKLTNYDFGVFLTGRREKKIGRREKEISRKEEMREEVNFNNLEIYNSLGEKLSWEEIVLNYLKFLNTFLREQVGVCIDKSIPRIIDNELTYLIVQRKDYKDYDENFFIAHDGEIIFPMINENFDLELALIKLAEWKNRAREKNLIKFQKKEK